MRAFPLVLGIEISEKSEMVAAKPEVDRSQLLGMHSKAILTVRHMFPGTSRSMEIKQTTYLGSGNTILKMAATKPEVDISQLVD